MNQTTETNIVDDLDSPVISGASEFKKPVQILKFDKNIRVVIWRRQTRGGPLLTAEVSRLYRDKVRDVVKRSNSFALGELGTLIRAAKHAQEVMADLAEQDGSVTAQYRDAPDRGMGDDGASPSSGCDPGGGVDDHDVPIVTAIDAHARPPDGR